MCVLAQTLHSPYLRVDPNSIGRVYRDRLPKRGGRVFVTSNPLLCMGVEAMMRTILVIALIPGLTEFLGNLGGNLIKICLVAAAIVLVVNLLGRRSA